MLPPIRYPLIAAVIALSGCKATPPPPAPTPPPQPVGATDLRDAIHKPLDRAQSVEGTLEKEKEKQDSQLNDAGG